METKICKTCNGKIELSTFPRGNRRDKWYYLPHCKVCTKNRKQDCKKQYRITHKTELDGNKR